MPERYLIRLPWPPAKSSPNGSQGDYRGKARAGKSYREMCAMECIAQGIRATEWGAATATITFHPPKNGRMDWDNMSARCKRGFDAVADAIGVDDGKWWPVTLQKGEKVPGGCVMIDIRDAWGER